jgi:hypothetical protein
MKFSILRPYHINVKPGVELHVTVESIDDAMF